MSIRRWLAVLVLGLGGTVALGAGPAAAQDCPIPGIGCETTTTAEPTTTLVPTTTPTTARPTTTSTTVRTATTARPATTTTEPPIVETTTTTTPTTEGPTTTSSIPLLVDGPPVDAGVGGSPATTSTTALVAVPASSDSNRTGRQVALAVGGLLLLAVVFAALTFWYWRRTKPRVAAAGSR